ncbi:lipoprotein insertase outer membrane protein LolB [Sutterella sp.]|uniref:lipoprotein insertase outer membrane protein LolB n=1 Tax=Sutterella sp. TaxID=1981025 RepID=UPI0026E02965|nr:lipoprotein insertase outer membrane protein LolB [Sutterella sp.]MDO5530713.1 lipoprotein insertase outer membrane protein LolB [Sutterella sp.]
MTARRGLLCGAAALAALLATGCAVTPPESRRWQGRFALRAPDGRGGTEAVSGRFVLLDAPGLLRLDLLTPLSGILARIEETPSGASFTRSLEEEPERAPDLDTLLTGLLGFTLPVRELRALLASGAAAPADASSGDWRCRVLARREDGTPRRMRIERGDIIVTLVLEEDA